MREEVREAAEREALEIVTAARRDVRRIIVEARRELLVLTAQMHAAVEATDAPGLPLPTFANLLAEPESARADDAPGDPLEITRDVVLEARKGVRSVLDEARAEIEALSSEAPGALAAAAAGAPAVPPFDWQGGARTDASSASAAAADDSSPAAGGDGPRAEGPVHELNLDAALSSLEFQTDPHSHARASPRHRRRQPAGGAGRAGDGGTSGLRALVLRHAAAGRAAHAVARCAAVEPADGDRGRVLSADVEPSPAAPLAFDTTPHSGFFDSLPARVGTTDLVDETGGTGGARLARHTAFHAALSSVRRRGRDAHPGAIGANLRWPLRRHRSAGRGGHVVVGVDPRRTATAVGRDTGSRRRRGCGDGGAGGCANGGDDARCRHHGAHDRSPAAVVDSGPGRRQGRGGPHLPGRRNAPHRRRAGGVDSRGRCRRGVHRNRRRRRRRLSVPTAGLRRARTRHPDHWRRPPSRRPRPRATPPRLRRPRRPRSLWRMRPRQAAGPIRGPRRRLHRPRPRHLRPTRHPHRATA